MPSLGEQGRLFVGSRASIANRSYFAAASLVALGVLTPAATWGSFQKLLFEKLCRFLPKLLLALFIDETAGDLAEEVGRPFGIKVDGTGDAGELFLAGDGLGEGVGVAVHVPGFGFGEQEEGWSFQLCGGHFALAVHIDRVEAHPGIDGCVRGG